MAVIGACTGFGAICGSSVATTATFARAALPQLRRYRYDPGFSCGVVAVGGTLGILIPPSVILVVYAISTEQNIAKLFQAALIPGLMAAAMYCLTIAIGRGSIPTLGPSQDRIAWRRSGEAAARRAAGAARRRPRHRRHLWRRVHADGRRVRRRLRHAADRRHARARWALPASARRSCRRPKPRR